MDKKRNLNLIVTCVLFIGMVAGFTLLLYPYFEQISRPECQAEIKAWSDRVGAAGFFLLFGVQVLQVVVAFIPGEPVEILAGVLYGAAGGMLICLAGCMFASAIIFACSGRFGKRLSDQLFGREKVSRWKWLQDSQKSELIIFTLFLIPGTPKDMLTYFAGITGMKTGKFIIITSLARIPSVLSSTMIGAAMIKGRWELSVMVFLLTGMIGIAGIYLKDRMIEGCRRKAAGSKRSSSGCEGLDFIALANCRTRYPVMYCRMVIEGCFDMAKFRSAVMQSGRYVPEIFYIFDFKRNCFVDRGFNTKEVFTGDFPGLDAALHWDLGRETQLRIAAAGESPHRTSLIIGMSHILTDGAGFLQYLYLLASLYNGTPIEQSRHNTRKITSLLNEIEVKGPTEQTGNGSRIKVLPLRTMNKGQGYYCLDSVITTEDMTAVYRKARSLNASVNDVFMTAWARVLGQYQQTDQVMLSCPADLRRFWPGPDRDRMTVANMTGIYGQVVVEHVREYSFDQLLSQVTIEMKLQKERSRCFTGIKLLNTLFRYLPKPLLKAAIRLSYPLQPVTYTNIGVVDDQKLFFQNCNISQCCLTGTYRQAPEFQLAISSFKNTCTLSSSLVGEEDELESCRSVLEQVKEEILVWVHDQPEIR